MMQIKNAAESLANSRVRPLLGNGKLTSPSRATPSLVSSNQPAPFTERTYTQTTIMLSKYQVPAKIV